MTGVILTLLFALSAALSGSILFARWLEGLDSAEKIGVCGLLTLGFSGLVVFFVGLLPKGLAFAVPLVVVVMVVGAGIALAKRKTSGWKFSVPNGLSILFVVALSIIGLIALVAVLAPSTSTDWDTIAYHLAVPKIWLERGQISFVQGMHQSNFPFTIECLFLMGLKWGGQSAAKAFSLAIYIFGCISVFGIARRWYGQKGAWWSALAFASIPIVAWESGTGYIDVAHGLFTTLGCIYAIEAVTSQEGKKNWILAGLCLGFALGTKYTGLQVSIALCLALLVYGLVNKRFVHTLKTAAMIALVAVSVGGSWYVKSAIYTGNPVFPFFSSILDGRDWDAWRASVYKNEQDSFGVGAGALDIGHAVLGLAYQPGRYTNPDPINGRGFPTGTVGFAVILVGVSAALFGRLSLSERLLLSTVAIGMLMWFLLSQQSRYLTITMIPLAVMAGAQATKTKWKAVMSAALAIQCLTTVFLLTKLQTSDQAKFVFGQESEDEYLTKRLAVYRANKYIQTLSPKTKVALYDEVFGYYLDLEYFWANPGHSMYIPYETADSAHELIEEMQSRGFTHIYINLIPDAKFVSALGFGSSPQPYTQDDRTKMMVDLNLRWKVLLSDAMQQGLIFPQAEFGSSVIFSLQSSQSESQ